MDYECFGKEFERLSGIRLSCYKEKQMKRRIETLIERKKLNGYEPFLALLSTDSEELAYFVDYITINVTEFFRTADHWNYLEDEILPDLILSSDRELKIWSSACSTGEEPYSVAMSLLRIDPNAQFQIIASDIDETVLKKARNGFFDERSLENISEDDRACFFRKTDSKWQINEAVRSHISFQKLDLLQDPFPLDCDLILCRNVLIYFTEESKDQIYRQFKGALKTNGYLFTGNTEQIVYYKMYGFKRDKSFVYRNN